MIPEEEVVVGLVRRRVEAEKVHENATKDDTTATMTHLDTVSHSTNAHQSTFQVGMQIILSFRFQTLPRFKHEFIGSI